MCYVYIFSVSLRIFPTSLRLSPLIEIEYSRISITNFILVDSIILNRFNILADWLHHLFLPSFVLGIYLSGIFVRLTYAQVTETLFKDFITAARARGIPERRILYKYGLRNALIPIVTMMGLQFAALLSGAVLTETVFNWPGIDSLVYESILARDYNLVQGSIIIYAFLVA